MTATDPATHIDFLLNQQTTIKGKVVRKSINKSNVNGAKYQTVKGSCILCSSITKPAMDKHRHKTEKKLRILSRLSGIIFLKTKAEIAPIKIKAMITNSIVSDCATQGMAQSGLLGVK